MTRTVCGLTHYERLTLFYFSFPIPALERVPRVVSRTRGAPAVQPNLSGADLLEHADHVNRAPRHVPNPAVGANHREHGTGLSQSPHSASMIAHTRR